MIGKFYTRYSVQLKILVLKAVMIDLYKEATKVAHVLMRTHTSVIDKARYHKLLSLQALHRLTAYFYSQWSQ